MPSWEPCEGGTALPCTAKHGPRRAVPCRNGGPTVFAGARAQLARLDPIAARLRRVVDLVQTGSSHSNAKDGLEATGLESEWDSLRQKLAEAAPSP